MVNPFLEVGLLIIGALGAGTALALAFRSLL